MQPRSTTTEPFSANAEAAVVRGGLIRVAGYVIGVGLIAATAPLLTRYLGVERFGKYMAVVSLIAIVGLISDAGLTVVGIREYVGRDQMHRRSLIRSLLALRSSMTLAGVACATVFAVAAGYDEAMVVGTVAAGVGLLLRVYQQTYALPLNAELRLGLVTAFEIGRQALTLAAILLLVLLGGTLVHLLAVPIPVGLALLSLSAIALRGKAPAWPSFRRAEWRYLIGQTASVAVAATIGALFYRSAIVLMSVIASDDETGYFGASFRLTEIVLMVPGLITASAFPLLAHAAQDDESRLSRVLQGLFDVAAILGAGTALVFALAARRLIEVFAGSEFAPAAPVLRIQALSMGLSFIVSVWAAALWAVRADRGLAMANALGVAAAVGLTAFLAPAHGAVGAAVAMVAAELLLAAAYGVALIRARPNLRPSLSVAPKVGIAVVVAGAIAFVPPGDLVRAPIGAIAFVAVVVALRGFPRDVWWALRGRAGALPHTLSASDQHDPSSGQRSQ